jgi:hypothetical protein
LYGNGLDTVGVPLMVMVLLAHAAVTPAGSPVAVPMPVAPVVACVIAVKAVLIHSVGVEEPAPAVLSGVTVTFTATLFETPSAMRLMAELTKSATTILPSDWMATPKGPLKPEPKVVMLNEDCST